MITLDQMRALEANSAWRGVSRRLLMENAGTQIVKQIWERNPPEECAVIFSGTGNNGGDGFVAARNMVNRGIEVTVVLLGRPRDITTSAAQESWDALVQMEEDVNFCIIRDSTELEALSDLKADVIIDAMLGTGITGELREPIASATEFINEKDAYKVAVDVPTGVNPTTGEVHGNGTECDLTVTFHDTKPGLEKAEKKYTGDIATADIGIPSSAEKRTGPGDVYLAIPPRRIGSHKGESGRLLIVGGSSQYVGAPALAGLSALNSGTDLVTIAAPTETAKIINSFSPDLITLKLPGENLEPEAITQIEEELDKSTAVIIGPGLGLEPETKNAVMDLMNKLVDDYPDLPVLLDADGLKIVSENLDLMREANCLVTPHAGEFELLSGSSLPKDKNSQIEQVSETAENIDAPILLKSHVDICADSNGRIVRNDTGNPGMTVGGTGDVLSGIVGAFASQGAKLFRSAKAGSFLCGLAGDLCSQEKGHEFIASDVKDKIPTAISNVREYW